MGLTQLSLIWACTQAPHVTPTLLRKAPCTILNTNTVTCDNAGTLVALTFTEASVHVYQPPMDAPVSQVFPLTTHKCPRQEGERWEGLQRGGQEDEGRGLGPE